jgi:hypothetical protein
MLKKFLMKLKLIEKHILLFILIKLFMRYQKIVNSENKLLNFELEWYSVLRTEETILNQCYLILKRRLQTIHKK